MCQYIGLYSDGDSDFLTTFKIRGFKLLHYKFLVIKVKYFIAKAWVF